jgi:hypothetical protein
MHLCMHVRIYVCMYICIFVHMYVCRNLLKKCHS